MIRKTLSLIFLLCIVTLCCFSQVEYELLIEREGNCYPSSIVEIPDNEAIISLAGYEQDYRGYAELIRLDQYGEIIEAITFPYQEDTSYGIWYIGKTAVVDQYMAMGCKTYKDDIFYLWLLGFDKTLNVLWEKIIDTLYISPFKMEYRFWNDTYFLSVSTSESRNILENLAHLYKMNSDYEIINTHTYYQERINHIYYLRNIPNSTDFLMNRPGLSETDVLVVNEDLDVVRSIPIPHEFAISQPLDAKYINDVEYIASGKMPISNSDRSQIFAIRKANLDNPLIQEKKFDFSRTEYEARCLGGAYKSLALQDQYFFFGGTTNVIPDAYPYEKNHLAVYAFNHGLDSLWSLEIGFDAYYVLYYIESMSDGGCIIAATRYDNEKGVRKRDAYIAKIRKPTLLDIEDDNELKALAVFPNPGKDYLNIQTDLNNFLFQLFDINGCIRIERRNEKNNITVSNLPSGLYLYRLTDDKGNTVQGKWIKQ